MLSAPTDPLAAGLQSLVVAVFLLCLGYMLASVLLGRRGDPILRAGLALPALCAYVLLLSILHLASGGFLFSHPWLVRGLTALVAGLVGAIAWRRRLEGRGRARAGVLLMLSLLGLGFVVWGVPAFRAFPLFDPLPVEFGGDTKLHLGWTMQMLNGERLPTSPLTGEIPNSYPWFFHALLAFVSNLVPGGRSFHGLGPLHFLQVGGGVLAFFALGREITKRYLGAAAAAAFGALSGGVGWVFAGGPALEMDRSDPMTYLGDLVAVRSYNSSFHNLAPTLPRDIAYVLLPAFLVLVLLGIRRRDRSLLVAGGVTAGILGLTGAESFFLCALGAAALGVVVPPGERLRTVLSVFLPLLAIWGLWAAPVAFNYLRLGGFEQTTTVGPIVVPPLGILGAWGLVTAVAAVGIAWSARRFERNLSARLILCFALSAIVLLVVAEATTGDGPFSVLGRPHRYWPLLHLALVPLGAMGAVRVAGSLRKRVGHNPTAWLLGAIVLTAVPAPVLGSIALSEHQSELPEAIVAAVREQGGSPLEVVDGEPGGQTCVVAVPEDLAHTTFWFSGHRLVHYRWAPYTEANFARVRWKDMSEHVPWDEERLRDNETLLYGSSTADAWTDTAQKYGVDHVITTAEAAAGGTFGDADAVETGDYVVLSRTDCGG